MAKYTYEDEFRFPLWEQIKRRAEEKDISYYRALKEVVPEYVQTIRYGDRRFEDEAVKKYWKEIGQLTLGSQKDQDEGD